MRKAPKIILVTAAALIGTGAMLSCGAWAATGFDTARLSTVNYDWHQTVSALEDEAASPHGRIVITSEFENVQLEPADGDAIELEYWTGNCQSVSVEDADGVLKIDVDSQPMEGVMIDLSPCRGRRRRRHHNRGSRARVVHRRDRGALRFGRRRRG